MIYQISLIARDVRVAIDENRDNRPLIEDEDVDTLSIEELVLSKVEDSVRRVVLDAPVGLLDNGRNFGERVFWRGNGTGWILLPENFLRLVIFRMSDWERPVFNPIGSDDPRYGLQFSRYPGIRGTPQKPVVAVVQRAEGRALEFFSCRSKEATVEQAVYIPYPKVDRFGGIEIPERCYRAVVYEAASLTLATVGQLELAAKMRELSSEALAL
ncbi:MAG: hypothetical protein HDS31_01700 [Bacteroides sp.]|nr:hypothetical protein [Bacteroides sp.]